MNVLFLTTVLPLRTSSGGEIVSDMLVKKLVSNGMDVDVVGYIRTSDSKRQCPKNYTSVETRIIETHGEKLQALLWMASAFVSGTGFSAKKYESKKYISIVKDKARSKRYDYIVIDHTQMLWILPLLPKSIKKIFISHNVESNLYELLARDSQSFLKKMILQRESKKMVVLEKKLIRHIDQIWALSDDDLNHYRKIDSEKKINYVTFDALPAISPPESIEASPGVDISILGTWSWDANMQGLKWFIDKVYPLLSKNLRIKVAGKGADWLNNKYENIDYCGFVDSAEEFMVNSKLILIPSISGAGVQIKTLDAITIGRPVIATGFALRGLNDYPSYVYEANEPETMANAISHTLSREYTQDESIKFRTECLSWFENKEIKINNIISQYLNSQD